jgi:hypothetical protein
MPLWNGKYFKVCFRGSTPSQLRFSLTDSGFAMTERLAYACAAFVVASATFQYVRIAALALRARSA